MSNLEHIIPSTVEAAPSLSQGHSLVLVAVNHHEVEFDQLVDRVVNVEVDGANLRGDPESDQSIGQWRWRYDPAMRFGRTLIALALAVVLVAGCGADPALNRTGAAPKASQGGVDLSAATFQDQTSDASVEVDAIDNLFRPKYIEVKAGTKITFRNDGRNSHNVLPVDERDFAEIPTVKFEPGTEVAITLDKPGDVPYYCSLHGTTTKGMIGAIRVVP